MIGYLVEQELMNALPGEARCATLLTQVEVDDDDPAFVEPTKPIGPVYTQAEAAQALSEHGWTIIEESPGNWRRVVPSPVPRHITQIRTIRLLRSEEHTSELPSLMRNSYAVFCLKKKTMRTK